VKLETLSFTLKDQIARITVDRLQALNALNAQVLAEFHVVLDEIEKLGNCRVVMITGGGEKAFVAGADIKEVDQLNASSARAFALNGQKLFSRIESLPQPVIAVVNGFALGGGLELALCCDFILASDKAKFGLPECTLGIIPGFGGTVRLPRRIGVGLAREMAYSGGFYSAQDAFAMSLANHIYPAAELMAEAEKLALVIASRAPLALRAIKQSMLEGMDLSQPAAYELEAKLFSNCFGSKDQQEGTKAFIEKRKAQFTGQ
jgi:enoyl-CoA hydratase